MITLALDAMGGDKAPGIVLKGADISRKRHPNCRFLLFGDERRIGPILKRFPKLRARCEIRHTEEAVAADEKPSTALRRGKRTSMRLAIDAVQSGEAAGVVSAGNTGALMAMAKFVLRTAPGIDRPAIAGFFPSKRGEMVMLDLGANIECSASNLVQFATMGAAFARIVLGIRRPTVGLLNVGTEEVKGHDSIREAAQILRDTPNLPMEFVGFVEGTDLGTGRADVFVTDGFTGNIALKTIEGTARFYTENLRAAFKRSVFSRLGYLLARPALMSLRRRLDPRSYNGALFVGLNGVVVKSHGGADAIGFASAISVAYDMAEGEFNSHMISDLHAFAGPPTAPGQEAAAS
jgi:glycerol-3-phosphate acyltransferase PlsX